MNGKISGLMLLVTGIWLIILYGIDLGMGDDSRLENGWALFPIGLIHSIIGVSMIVYNSRKRELIQTTLKENLELA